MFAQKISPADLIDIIAAPSYCPNLLSYVNKISDANLLKDYLTKKAKLGVTGTIAKDYVESGTPDAIPYLSTKQVSGLYAYIDDAKYISKSADLEWKKCRVNDGDIVINKSGNVGAAAIVKAQPYKYVNSVSDIISIEVDQSLIDKEYLVVYLNSPYGQKQLQRLSGGAIFNHVSLHAIPDIKVFRVNNVVQKYIGDKVRQAELLREWSKCKKNKLDLIFDKETRKLGYIEKSPKKYTRCKLDNRLDPAYYSSNYSFLDEEWFRNISFRLKNYIASGSYGVLPNSNAYGMGTEKFIRATDLPSVNINPKSYIVVPFEEVSAKAKVSTGEILLEIKGAISECQLASHYLNGYYVNGSIYRFKVQNIDAAYLTFYLRSFIKKLYCDRVSVNNIISYLDLESINNLPVVRLGDEIENIISQEFLLIELAQQLIFRISKSAQYLVEALILGVIDENKLVQAQNALEQGDNSLDRAILSQMTEEGYAVAGSKPLFADLDEFYELLEQAKELE